MKEKNNSPVKSDYVLFLNEIKQKITTSRIKAYRGLNKELIGLYWDLGRIIVKKQEEHGWGKSIVEKLSLDLQKEFDSRQGFSPQNLRYMRQFYIEYKDYSNLQQLVGELPWGHNIMIFSKIKDPDVTEYYLSKKLPKKFKGILPDQKKLKEKIEEEL